MNIPTHSNNPLQNFTGLPRFAEILPAHVTPAVDNLLRHNSEVVSALLSETTAPTWGNFVDRLDDANEKMARAWGQVSHLNAVMNSAEFREVYNENLPKITQYYAELGQNLALFAKYKLLRNSEGFNKLTPARKKIIENELRDFRLSGAELAENKKARFLEIQDELSSLSSRFSDNLLDATNDFSMLIENDAELVGIPADDLQAAREAAQATNKTGWLFTLKAPSYMPVMQYAENRKLREKMYVAYSQRASEFGKAEWDNTPLILQILKLRAEESKLLGFANYAELSLASKMANTPEQILKFLRELAQHARPLAEKDLQELQEFASKNLAMTGLEAWDIGYVSEKLRQQRYAFSDQEVKQYFPEDIVIAGMFNVVEKIYTCVCAGRILKA